MSESVRKTEVRRDPCSESDSGAFFPPGGLDTDKTGHLHKEQEETQGRATWVSRVFQRLNYEVRFNCQFRPVGTDQKLEVKLEVRR